MDLPICPESPEHHFQVALIGKGSNKPPSGNKFGVLDREYTQKAFNKIAILATDLINKEFLPPGEFRAAGFGSQKWILDSGFSGIARVLFIPTPERRSMHKEWSKRLSRVKTHNRSWGFARGKSSIDMCRAHATYWGTKKQGDLSFLSMDLEGFFPSISGDMVAKSMVAHGFSETDTKDFISSCMLPVRNVSFLIHSINSKVQYHTTSILWLTDNDAFPLVTGKASQEESIQKIQKVIFESLLGFGPTIRGGEQSWVLPQGSSVSPPVSNLVCKIMDYRLSAYLEKCGCFYTRYADDLTISWKGRKTKKSIALIAAGIKKIVEGEGFKVNRRKTLIMGPGMRQHVIGYNMNSGGPTVPRAKRVGLRNDVEELISGAQPSFSEFERRGRQLLGVAEYISSAHKEEADRAREKIHLALSGEWRSNKHAILAPECDGLEAVDDRIYRAAVYVGEQVDH